MWGVEVWVWVIWAFERAYERWWLRRRSDFSAGLGALDGSMMLAAYRRSSGMVRFLVNAGANPAARGHEVFFVMSTFNDHQMMDWICERSRPSADEVGRAISWARQSGHPETVEWIERMLAAGVAQEIEEQALRVVERGRVLRI